MQEITHRFQEVPEAEYMHKPFHKFMQAVEVTKMRLSNFLNYLTVAVSSKISDFVSHHSLWDGL